MIWGKVEKLILSRSRDVLEYRAGHFYSDICHDTVAITQPDPELQVDKLTASS